MDRTSELQKQEAIGEEFLAKQHDSLVRSREQSPSTYFDVVDKYRLIMSEEEILRGVQHVADVINTSFPGERIVLVGVLKGCFMFLADLVKRLTRPYSVYFIEAWSYSGQAQGQVEFLSRLVPEKLEKRHVIVVDELLDRGHTLHRVSGELMRSLSLERSQVTTCVLFSKHMPTRDPELNADIVGVPDLPDLWLVGYGLDDVGTKRGWTHLYARPKAGDAPRVEDDTIFEEKKTDDDAAGAGGKAEAAWTEGAQGHYRKLRSAVAARLEAGPHVHKRVIDRATGGRVPIENPLTPTAPVGSEFDALKPQ